MVHRIGGKASYEWSKREKAIRSTDFATLDLSVGRADHVDACDLGLWNGRDQYTILYLPDGCPADRCPRADRPARDAFAAPDTAPAAADALYHHAPARFLCG